VGSANIERGRRGRPRLAAQTRLRAGARLRFDVWPRPIARPLEIPRRCGAAGTRRTALCAYRHVEPDPFVPARNSTAFVRVRSGHRAHLDSRRVIATPKYFAAFDKQIHQDEDAAAPDIARYGRQRHDAPDDLSVGRWCPGAVRPRASSSRRSRFPRRGSGQRRPADSARNPRRSSIRGNPSAPRRPTMILRSRFRIRVQRGRCRISVKQRGKSRLTCRSGARRSCDTE